MSNAFLGSSYKSEEELTYYFYCAKFLTEIFTADFLLFKLLFSKTILKKIKCNFFPSLIQSKVETKIFFSTSAMQRLYDS